MRKMSILQKGLTAMKDIINTVVEDYERRGKGVEAIRKYIRSKYRINIDKAALLKRLELLKIQNPA